MPPSPSLRTTRYGPIRSRVTLRLLEPLYHHLLSPCALSRRASQSDVRAVPTSDLNYLDIRRSCPVGVGGLLPIGRRLYTEAPWRPSEAWLFCERSWAGSCAARGAATGDYFLPRISSCCRFIWRRSSSRGSSPGSI